MTMTTPALRCRLLLAAAIALVASACDVRTAIDITVNDDDSGVIEIALSVDPPTAGRMIEAAEQTGSPNPLDLGAQFEAVDDRWQVEPITASADAAEGGQSAITGPNTGWRLRAEFADLDALAALLNDFHAGLADDDARLFRDLVVERRFDGGLRVDGEVGVQLPEVLGIESDLLSFDGDDLDAFVEEFGDEVLESNLTVTLPMQIASSNADEQTATAARWTFNGPGLQPVDARTVAGPTPLWLLIAVGVSAAIAAGIISRRIRRRRELRRVSVR